jgi:hypothetical protein
MRLFAFPLKQCATADNVKLWQPHDKNMTKEGSFIFLSVLDDGTVRSLGQETSEPLQGPLPNRHTTPPAYVYIGSHALTTELKNEALVIRRNAMRSPRGHRLLVVQRCRKTKAHPREEARLKLILKDTMPSVY